MWFKSHTPYVKNTHPLDSADWTHLNLGSVQLNPSSAPVHPMSSDIACKLYMSQFDILGNDHVKA